MSNFRNSFVFNGSNPKIFLGSVEYSTIATKVPSFPMVKASMTLVKNSLSEFQWAVILLELSITSATSIAAEHLNGVGTVVGTAKDDQCLLTRATA